MAASALGGAAVAEAEVIPRWEWRVFGTEYASAERAFAALPAGPVEETDEIYLVGAAENNVKIRNGLLDVKLLREVDPDGLQRWEPVLKRAFPVPHVEVKAVLDALGVAAFAASRDAYTVEEFLAGVTEGGPAVRVVRLHKRRTRYALPGCKAEIADIDTDTHSVRTIAVESEDASAVIRAVRELGLGDSANTSYQRGLAALVDEAACYAVIDIGTNSVKFHIGSRDAGGAWRTLVDRAEVTRLGQGLSEVGSIQPEPLDRTIAAIEGMVEEAGRHQVREIAAVGTAGLRMAGNRDEVTATISARTGLTIEVISGAEESRLDHLAVQAGLDVGNGSVTVFDTGGGSSQFTFGRSSDVDQRFSLPVGAVLYTERFGLAGVVEPGVLNAAQAAISADLSRLDGRPRPDLLVGMGGALTNLTAVKLGLTSYDPERVHGTVLDRAEIERQIELYRSRDADSRRQIDGLQPNRAEVILAGACIVRTVLEKLDRQDLVVSDRGIRHAVLRDRFGR
jgi:exopolyphosphatase/guanosine-5'-triphosphate,3'-diphosphate pyrophosphatase